MKNKIPLTHIYYTICPGISYQYDARGMVEICYEQNHWIQRLFRKLGFSLPEKTYKSLDAYGTFIFQRLSEENSVYDLGQQLKEAFPEMEEQLYPRLLAYLDYLEKNEQLIQCHERPSN